MACTGRVRSALNVALFVLLAVGFGVAEAAGQTTGKRVFSTGNSCELATVLTTQECRNAHDNALAELDEKSPRFASRAECEKSFKQCMIAGIDRQRVEFEPALRGFEVNVRAATDKTAIPVIDGDGSSLGFHPRTVLHADKGVSNSLRAQAQQRWAQAQRARAEAAAARPPNGDQGLDAAPDAPSAVSRPPTARDLAAAARRREELRSAPTVY
ncbi:MAG: DUF1190 domain-containing protein [Alphaproteobacteria bacterium]|nr:DUF1190 domain-containing protein [Alphaproteobacteria bacterium]